MSPAIRAFVICIALQFVSSASLEAAPLAAFRLQVEDLSDNPITTVNVNQDFQLAAYVEDIRDPSVRFPGVWAAFMDVTYEAGRVSIPSLPSINPNPGDPGNFGDPGIDWGSYFALGLRYGDLATPGLIEGAGSASLASEESGLGEALLWKITMHGIALGTAVFSPTFDANIDHDSSFIDPSDALAVDQILYIGDSVQIVPEPSSLALAMLGVFGILAIARRKRRVCGFRLLAE